MKKTIISLGYAIVIMCTCTGCTNELELFNSVPEKNCKIIADYMACTVLKYQVTENYKYLGDEQQLTRLTKVLREKEQNESAFNTDVDKSESANNKNEIDEESTIDNNQATESETENISIATVLGLDDVSIKYDSYSIVDKYSQDDVYIIEPEEGYELLILQFDVENLSQEQKTIMSMNVPKMQARLFIGDEKYLPLMTAIENDIMSMKIVVDAGNSTKAIIIYQIKKETVNGDLKFEILSDKDSVKLSLN